MTTLSRRLVRPLMLTCAMLAPALAGAAGAGGAAGSTPAAASAGFEVRIELRREPATGLCVSETVSGVGQAAITIVCSTGQFVEIEPRPGAAFVGTHGGAFRYSFGPRSTWNVSAGGAAGFSDVFSGSGTVTSMRIVRTGGVGLLDGGSGSLEMLVSF